MQNVRLKVIILAAALGVVLYLKNCVSWQQALPGGEEPSTNEPATEVNPDAAAPVLE